MGTKSIEQIKEEYAGEHGRDSWEEFFQWNTLCHTPHDIMQDHYNEIMKRYAKQFQAPTKDLEDWKESSLRVMKELNLQAIGYELGLKLGSSIAPQVLPEIMGLKERVHELEGLLNKLYNSDGWLAPEDHKRIQSLINKSK